jgi:hypothetical protein
MPTTNNQIMMGTSTEAVYIPGSLTTIGPSNTFSGSIVMTLSGGIYSATISYTVLVNTFGMMSFSLGNYSVGAFGTEMITSTSTFVNAINIGSVNVSISNGTATLTTGNLIIESGAGSPLDPSADVTLLYSYVRLY